jgi:hypothetical protein
MIRDYKVLASAARTAAGQSADLINEDASSVGSAQFVIDVTAVSGTTPVLVVIVEGFDPTSGKYVPLLTSANITVTGTTVLHVGPGLPATANVSANALVTRNFRVRFTITGTTPSFTFSVGASVV